MRRNRARGATEAGATGLGDVSLSLGYEYLPDWSYSPWRPKGVAFLAATFPTGGSIYDSTELYRIDFGGKGFFSLSLGTFFVKSWGNWDASLFLEGHRSFSRTITNENGVLVLRPGWGGSGLFSVGVSPVAGPVQSELDSLRASNNPSPRMESSWAAANNKFFGLPRPR